MTRDLPARPSGPTTLSSLAHSGQVAAPRSRLGLIVGASAVVVGGAIGSALALRMAPASAAPRGRSSTEVSAGSPRTGAQVPATPGAAPSTGTSAAAPRAGTQTAAISPGTSSPGMPAAAPTAAPAAASGAPAVTAATGAPPPAANPSAAVAAATAAASAAAVPPSPEARVALVAQIKDTLQRFIAWSHAHPGARCPDAAALGAGLDPWGQPLQIVCSDQPADQIAGVLSYGPDGQPGTRDDVVSWALGADVTDLAHGPRWSASRGMAASGGGRHGGAHPGPRTNAGTPPLAAGAAPRPTAPLPTRPPAAGAGSNDTDGDGIPDRR